MKPASTACGATKNGCAVHKGRFHTTHSQEQRAHHVASYPLFVPPARCFLLVTAVSHWTQPEFLTVVSLGMFDQPGLLWVFGMLTFTSGLAVVLGHNDWSNNPAALVSFLGWLLTIEGAALLLIPAAGWKAILGAHFPSHAVLGTIISAVMGAYLTYAGLVRRR